MLLNNKLLGFNGTFLILIHLISIIGIKSTRSFRVFLIFYLARYKQVRKNRYFVLKIAESHHHQCAGFQNLTSIF
jgi:hypothetical protein